ERAAYERAIRDQAARDQVARDQAMRDQVAARDQASREQASREQGFRDSETRELVVREQAERDQYALDQLARAQAVREQAAQDEAEETERAAGLRGTGTRPDGRPEGEAVRPRTRKRRFSRAAVFASVFVVVVVVVVSVIVATRGSISTVLGPPAATGPRVDAASPVLGAMADGAKMPTTSGIAAALAKPLRDSRLGPHVSVAVTDLSTGELLYGHGENSPTVPASTMKLATATAVLALRGPDYRITTQVVAGGHPGEVVLVGAGDPTLAAGPEPAYPEAGRLDVLADQVKRALGGVAPTKVIVDSSLFSGPVVAPGWNADDLNGDYASRIYALTTDAGRIHPDNGAAGKRYVNSATAAGQIFAKLLGLPNSAVSQGVAPAEPGIGADPTTPGAVLGSVQSAPLQRIIDTMLSASDNVLAEFMARQVALASGKPASFAGAAQAVTDELRKLGLPLAGVHIVDGSGLSRQDRLTPSLLTSLISYDAQPAHTDLHAVFTGIPVAGWSGTLAGRFDTKATNGVAGTLRAKTGSLNGVSSLAGILIDADGRTLAFAVMVDKIPGGADAPKAIDTIGAALGACGCSS
ncbi:MAG TPA: D-alanyl-D-alanine carboxypeptidase/D-alanyl-D-alanine-endopeptidase, partial [Micromonosporaceae bacterium]|nr:D-alanyl-D-alanine carboxypeptidase/D-alanyl-D-alanine-endopeptidase [Micromonosporaceae bacterium]